MSESDNNHLLAQLERLKAEAQALANETAAATDRILDICDALGKQQGQDNAVSQAIADIYESCGVQDVIRQRVGIMMRVMDRIIDPSLPDVDPLLEGPQLQGAGIGQDDVDRLLNEDSE